MKKEILPIWFSHASNKSILTWWKPEECTEGGPDSIISLAKENSLKQIFFVSPNFHDFLEAWKNCNKADIQLIFGLEMWLCDNAFEHNEESLHNEHKVIIFGKNSQSYSDLIKIYSACHTNKENKYYKYRFDLQQLKPLWTDNLVLALPFFDSFIARNLLAYGANIVPGFPMKPVIMREINSGLPFEGLINSALDRYNVNKEYEEINTKTICYNKKEDVKAWQVYRSIHLRSTFNKPEMDYCCSSNFSVENYKELIA